METKKALLIACNYFNTPSQLSGCINDAIQWYTLLQDVYGFEESDITFLRDDKSDFKPTHERILSELTNLVNEKAKYSFIFYSGHGTSLTDMNGDEKDKVDECILPCDYQTKGIITDDIINGIVSNNKSTCLAIFDCCRSGTVLDLPIVDILNTNTPTPSPNNLEENKLICISGCKDNENSAEVFNLTNMLPQGALTITFLHTLRKMKYYPKISDLLNTIRSDLSNGGLNQQPILTSSYQIYNDTLFPLVPNFVKLELQNKILTTQSSILTAQNKNLSSTVTFLTSENKILTTQNKNLSVQVSSLSLENKKLTSQISSFTSNTQTSSNTINSLTTQNKNLSLQISNLKSDNKSLLINVSLLKTQNSNLLNQIKNLTTQLFALKKK
jgi:hypothetical protein